MDKLFFKISALLISILLYIAMLLFLFHHFFNLPKAKKIQIKAQSIDIVVQEEEKKVKKVLPKPIKKPLIQKKIAKKRGSLSAKQKSASIENLFRSIHTSNKAQEKKRATPPSRFKGTGAKAKELLEKLKLKEMNELSKKSIKSVVGQKSAYLEEVYKILYTYWNPSKFSAGNRVKVSIEINEDGSMEYEFLEYSKSEIFNKELDQYLQTMKFYTFPKPKRKEKFIVYFEAKE